jgi:ribosome-binding factor A
MSLRLQRVRELLKREIGEVIRRELPVAEAGLININDVMVSADLHSALVYVGIFGTDEQKKRGAAMLHKEQKRIQGLVGQAVVLKYTPKLRFVVTDSIEKGNRVLEILEELDKTSHSQPEQPQELEE